jgi:hypothetical protein
LALRAGASIAPWRADRDGTGPGHKTSFALGGIAGGGGFGAWSDTPEGKMISLAFADAYNNLVRSLRTYRAQDVAGGLGRGGWLKVSR